MIDKLRKKLILICALSVVSVFLLIFATICVFGIAQLNGNMDMLTERISAGNGVFVPYDNKNPMPNGGRFPDFINEETPFSTRFFTVFVNQKGEITGGNLENVSSVTKETATDYAERVLHRGNSKGWVSNYRYKVTATQTGKTLVFVDGSMNLSTTSSLITTSGAVLLGSAAVVILLIAILSKRAVKPVAQSYERQKQFVTDANHELKTPLTLIMTNLDIVESETGKNEWIDDIRTESKRMSTLVNELTALSKLDEETPLEMEHFFIDETIKDVLSEFGVLANKKGVSLFAKADFLGEYKGDEGAIRRLTAILLDNAVKYCDEGGEINFTLTSKKNHPIIIVENSFANLDERELPKLFDRFYRSDKARTAEGTSFGIGLSLAKEIVRKHRGEITAYKPAEGKIAFRVILK